MKLFEYYNYLGFHNPYYRMKEGHIVTYRENAVALGELNEKSLDFTAIVEILSTGYCFGDRTLVKEIKKTPWMACVSEDEKSWEFFALPKHQELLIDEKSSYSHFYNLLEIELRGYVEAHNTIGILLTGGMDSRIVAAVLNNLMRKGDIGEKRVIAYTWGLKDSRDVVYAQRIAEIYKWEWRHVSVDIDQMMINYDVVVSSGCEYTPIHLHAMTKVADQELLDCVLGGSFGDSIGRGEYSGVKAKNLRKLEEKIKNPGGILREDYLKLSKENISHDLKCYREQFPAEEEYQQFEQDLQLHYMRRMLNACMSQIDKKIPMYQMFTAPDVYRYIWSIHPDFRTDLIYKLILDNYAPELKDIPWARTGLLYPLKEGVADKFKKRHHNYGHLIRSQFLALIEKKIDENIHIAEQIFNVRKLKNLIKNCQLRPLKSGFSYEEKLLWIAALLDYIAHNKIVVDLPKKPATSLLAVWKEDLAYKLKYYYKMVR